MRSWTRLRTLLAATASLALLGSPALAQQDGHETSAAAPADTSRLDTSLDVEALRLVAAQRREAGLPALVEHLQLTRIARAHARHMAGLSDRGGRCGDGETLRHRSPISSGVTADWRVLRENVGCHVEPDVARIHRAFMQSPTHRANLLADDVTFVGVGSWRDAGGALWVTHLFMRGGVAPDLAVVREGLAAAADHRATGTRFEGVVLSRADVFADSLAGAALAGDDLPILFTDAPGGDEADPVLRPGVRAAIDDLTGGHGRVYVLGGTKAVGPRVESELRDAGYDVRRLSGADRVATGVAIAREVVARNGAPARVLIASALAWPDAVTGSVAAARAGVPVLLTDPADLHPAAAAFLSEHRGARRVVLGGAAAVSDRVAAQAGATRVRGSDRVATSEAIAAELFEGAGDEVMLIDGYATTSWATSLAWAGRSVRLGTPQLLTAPGPGGHDRSWRSSRRAA